MFPIRAIHQIEMTSRCNQARAQMAPEAMRSTVWYETPNRAAIDRLSSPALLAALIRRARSISSFFARLVDIEPSRRPASTACRWFSACLHHSRFSTALFALLKSRWFTCASACGASAMNAAATSRCIFFVVTTFFLDRFTVRYPRLSDVWRSIRPCLSATLYRFFTTWSRLRILPKELISYKPSYPAIGSHLSICEYQ